MAWTSRSICGMHLFGFDDPRHVRFVDQVEPLFRPEVEEPAGLVQVIHEPRTLFRSGVEQLSFEGPASEQVHTDCPAELEELFVGAARLRAEGGEGNADPEDSILVEDLPGPARDIPRGEEGLDVLE